MPHHGLQSGQVHPQYQPLYHRPGASPHALPPPSSSLFATGLSLSAPGPPPTPTTPAKDDDAGLSCEGQQSCLPGREMVVASTVPPRVATISGGQQVAISYRRIRPSDLEALEDMHQALFPIRYEAEFFEKVVHGQGIISWAAIDTSRPPSEELVGFITARVVSTSESEESALLGYEFMQTERTLVYILTLGVLKPYRNIGVASSLVWRVIDYANSCPSVRALYLHVIAYNRSAILFYKKNLFQCIRKLYNFYKINGQYYDAFVYVYYVNGGRPPCSPLDLLSSTTSFLRSFCATWLARLSWKKQEDDKGAKWLKCRGEICGPISPGRISVASSADSWPCV
eukprot:TRINITY_DN2698_c0_g1_i1.p1 TRINITY_DN2698_c0_g1~~TRINITY_DN2698_c0_g1_i1.p1  ORF type:complete len:341 (+),score=33.91 TRINITY_DN2698_c0_g1_i1:108-1130(+)